MAFTKRAVAAIGETVVEIWWEMAAYQMKKRGTAGGSHLLALLISLRPFLGFGIRYKVSSDCYVYHILKTKLLYGIPNRTHGNIYAELTLSSRGNQGIYRTVAL